MHKTALVALSLMVLILGISPQASAINASPEPVDLQQPDGTRIRLRIRGDEYFHWFEDMTGYTVIANAGEYFYADVDGTGHLTPTALRVGVADPSVTTLRKGVLPSPQVIAQTRQNTLPLSQRSGLISPNGTSEVQPPSAVSPVGVVRNLVVLCKFSDHDDTKIRAQSDYDTICNTPGGDATLAPSGSVRDYYKEASYNIIDLQSTVLAWVTLPHTEAYYANGTSGLGGSYPANPQGMVEDALNLIDPLVDLGQFDSDNDGYIDAIDIIHSGYAAETGGGSGNWIWSHKWSLWALAGGAWTSQDNNGLGVKVKVYDYHTEAALWGTSGTGITRIGVICHETGHFFGLPDLYDTDGSSQGIGSYCLMANSWGFDGSQLHPPHFSAWCKAQLGWVTPTVITPGTYTALQGETNKSIFKITSGYGSGEYLLIENRQPAGFETAMPQGGLAIWHIDENKSGNTSEGYPGQSGWPGNNNHYKIALLQADGLYGMEHNLNRGDAGDVYRGGGVSTISPGTVPNTNGYKSGIVTITNNKISGIAASSSSMAFTYSIDTTPAITSSLTASCTANTAFSYQITATNSPTSFNASGLPSGLSINTGTGLISGTPTAAGSYSVTLNATNLSGVGTATLDLTVTSPGVLFDSYTGATITYTSSTPHTFMGLPMTLGTGGGTSNINVAGGTAYLMATASANYSNIRLNIVFWGAASGAITGTTPAFSNSLGSFSFDLGPLNAVANTLYPYAFTLPSAVTMPGQTGGVTISWQGDTGSGLTTTENLTTALRYSSALQVGSLSVGTAGTYGYYRNASNETDGNFLGGSYRSLTGLTNQCLALKLLGSLVPPMALTNAASGVGSGTATLNASVNPAGATTTANFQYGTTTSYGSTAPIALSPGNGLTAQNVSAAISGLSASTLYHYRVVATNSYGTTTGRDLTFTTTVGSAATVTNVTSSTTNGAYKAGATIPITVTFSSAVTVTGTPQLQLNSGGSVFANYSSGSGTANLIFNYVVGAGQTSGDLDYTATTALTLNGGSITNADLTLAAPGGAGSLGANKALVIDTTAPTVAVTPTSTTLTSSPIIFTLTFSEAVTGLTSSAITVTNGTKGTLSGSGATYLFPVTPTTEGPVTCQVNAGAAQDAALNGSTVSNNATVTFVIPPTVVVTPSGTATSSGLINFTLTFSAPVTGLTTSGINVTNGAKGALTGSGATYTLPVTPSGQGDVTCQVQGNAAFTALSAGNWASNVATVTYDTVVPTVAVTPSGTISKISPVVFTLTFSEAVSGLTAAGITVTNGSKGALSGSGNLYTLSVTPLVPGVVTCQVDANAAVDAALNASLASNNASVTYTGAPTVVVTPSGTASNASPIVFTLTFSEAVTGLTESGIAVTNGSKGTLTGSGSVYTLPVTPSGQGAVTCQIPGDSALNSALVGNVASNQASVNFDTVAPTVVATTTGSATKTAPIVFTLTFSETVTGLTAGGITVTNGAKGALSGSGTVYTLPVTPSGEGSVTCQVNAGAAQDAAGNACTLSNTASIVYDTVAPSVIVSAPGTGSSTAPITFTMIFSEPVTGLTAGGITVTNGSKGTLTGSGTVYSIPVTPTGQGAVTCRVNAGAAQDAATNGSAISNLSSITYDSIAPTVVVTPSGSGTNLASITFTMTFSEAVTGLTQEGITVGNGAVTNFAVTSPSVYTLAVTPSSQGAVTCTVSAGAAQDTVGNLSNVSNTATVTYDTIPPTVAITPSGTTSKSANLTFALAFSEPVTGLTVGGITVTNGVKGLFSGSGSNYTLQVTASGQGAVTCTAGAGAAHDVGNNNNSVSNTASVIYDSIAPSFTAAHIASDNAVSTRAKVGDTITFTFTVSETLLSDPIVSLAGQTASLNQTGANAWTATLLVNSSAAQGAAAISTSLTDLAGNSVILSATTDASSVTVDRTAPSLSTVHLGSNNTLTALAKESNSISLSFYSSETIQPPTVTIAGQAASVTNPTGNYWVASIVVAGNAPEGPAAVNVTFTDVAGNDGVAVTATNDASSVKIDRTPPTLSPVRISSDNSVATLAKVGNLITLNFTSNEVIQQPSVSLAGQTANVTNINGNLWMATTTVAAGTAQGSVTISIASTDAVGNVAAIVSATTDASTVTVDRTTPALTAVHISSNNPQSSYAKVGDTLTLLLTADEALKTPTVTLAGQSASVTKISGNDWRATRLLTSGAVQGVAALSISFSDQAGNPGTTVTASTDGSTVTIDNALPVLTAQSGSRTVSPKAQVIFSIAVNSLSPVTYQWRKNGVAIEGANDATYGINSVAEADEARYDCVFNNIVASDASEAVDLFVNDPIVITADLSDKSVNLGESVELAVTVTGTKPITYQWRKNGVVLPDSDQPNWLIPAAQVGDSAYYDVVISNIVGDQPSAKVFLSVLGGPPRITRQPAPRTVQPDTAVTFSVSVAGAAPFTYQWRKNGTAITGATAAAYTLNAAAAADSGAYTVKVTNPAGSVISDAATLLVKPAALVFTTMAGVPATSGYANGTGAAALFARPNYIVSDSSGNLFVTDRSNFVIRKITPDGTVTVFAGTPGGSGTLDGTGAAARFNALEGIGIDGADNLYVADSSIGTIRRITPEGVVTTLAGHYTDPRSSEDGLGISASFNLPRGIAVDDAGVIYVSESGGHTIRRILPDGTVTTVAGKAGVSGSTDGNGAAALFNRPAGLALDSAGNLYVADESNHLIRKITPAGDVTTFAGTKGVAGAADGAGTSAKFSSPTGVAVDDTGSLLVVDTGNHTLRLISPSRVVTTLGGLAGAAGAADGPPALARFRSPHGITTDSAGRLYIADTENHTLRKGSLVALPEITEQPQSQLVSLGQPATFTVAADGIPPLSYQWMKNGTKIVTTGPALTTPSYTTPPTTLTSAGSYSVAVSGPAGSVVSAGARLGVVNTAATTLIVNEATPLALTVAAAGENLTYEWRKDGMPLSNGGRVSGVNTTKLTITPAIGTDTGNYTCMVRLGDIGLASGAVSVSIRLKPVLPEFSHLPWIASGTVTDSIVVADQSLLNRPTSYSASGLPAGMTINKTTGKLGGKPNAPGLYPVKITVTNAAGSTTQTVGITVNALPEACMGTFNGLADRDTTLSAPVATPAGQKLRGHGGSLYNLVITNGGMISGTLNLEDKAYALPAGSRLDAFMDDDPVATITLVRGTATDTIPDLIFSFTIDRASGELTGSVTDGLPASTPVPVHAWRNCWKTTATVSSAPNPSNLAGNYTAVLDLESEMRGSADHPEIPQGAGYITLTVTGSGVATWSGKLADGAAITGSVTMGPDGEIPLHLLLYTPTSAATAGSLHGWTRASRETATLSLNGGRPLLDGVLDWQKLPQPPATTTRSYKDGFPLLNLIVTGGVYVAPPAKTPILGLTDSGIYNNALLTFSEAGLADAGLTASGSPAGSPPGTLNQLLRITKTNTADFTGSPTGNPGIVTLTIVPASGLISGAFTLKDTTPPRVVPWVGILVPRLALGAGQFQLPQLPNPATAPTLSGQVLLQPQTP